MPQNYWLKNKRTNQVVPRTARLAKRDDYEPISDEMARKLLAQRRQERQDEVARRATDRAIGDGAPVPEDETKPAKKKAIKEMTADELRAEAAEAKIHVEPDATLTELRKAITEQRKADAAEREAEEAKE